jgi:hypothetical protein
MPKMHLRNLAQIAYAQLTIAIVRRSNSGAATV